ncbi:hypothetical protein ACFSC3_11440 [Sphingomonas floccifaciens]|uniref:Uncharacterized protein n=1 Tax=Sphingomonas floccifaciens TaxID=1844115 RepID=A0ABW4NDH0_9SPHN
MNAVAKITKTERGESIEMIGGFGFDTSEVRVVRVGDQVFLEAVDAIDEDTGLPMQKLRELIQEGLDSGPAESWDRDELRRFIRTGER